MQEMKIHIWSIIAVISFISCVREVTPDFSNFRPDLVINGLMVPDSVVKINITTSLRADEKDIFPAVDDVVAEISDGISIYRLFSKGNGNYTGEFNPVCGTTYTLNVVTRNGRTLTAATRIPFIPDIRVTSLVEENYIQVTIRDNPSEENYYWIGKKNFDIPENRTTYDAYVESNFLFFDDFNRTSSTDRYGRNTYAYQFYARLTDLSFNGKEAAFTIPHFWIPAEELNRHKYRFILYVINADRHLDHYMKAALVQYDLSVIGDIPVFHTPVSIYSNISGGKGIFGSYTLSEFDITLP
jgi:hypothetical protein